MQPRSAHLVICNVTTFTITVNYYIMHFSSYPVFSYCLALFLLAGPTGVFAQTITAEKILEMVNAQQEINLTNTTIEGDLDFTQLDNKREENTGGDRQAFRSTVDVPLSFTGCTFTGKVLGFVNDDGGWSKSDEPIYHANFSEEVVFTACKFKEDVDFKYSVFRERADFHDSEFRRYANFKYTEIRRAADFRNVVFQNEANFKYTEFSRSPTFDNAVFEDLANFKYTELNDGVSFANCIFRREASFKYTDLGGDVSYAGAQFKGEADFKYVKFPRGTDLTNTSFGRYTDFKYATLDGKKFRR